MAFAGFDIGTTTIKAILIDDDGAQVGLAASPTPVLQSEVTQLDLPRIREFVDHNLAEFRKTHTVQGIAFDSIGESVVPVDLKTRKALDNPLMWHERAPYRDWLDHQDLIAEHLPWDRCGVIPDYTFSLFKILWSRRCRNLETPCWLPVCSWLAYAYGADPIWESSQASRTAMNDVHAFDWAADVFDKLGLDLALNPISAIGKKAGETADGIAIGLGGHDHATAFYGLLRLFQEHPQVVNDSMGTAALISTLLDAPDGQGPKDRFMPWTGTVSMGGRRGEYCLNSDMRYFGSVFETWKQAVGFGDLDALHRQIEADTTCGELPLLQIGGDPFAAKSTLGMALLCPDMNVGPARMLQTIYGYYAALARFSLDGFKSLIGPPFWWISGGGPTRNDVLLRWKASMLGLPIHVPQISELSALGAAIAAMDASGSPETVTAVKRRMNCRTIDPDSRLSPQLEELYQRYRELSAQDFGALAGKIRPKKG